MLFSINNFPFTLLLRKFRWVFRNVLYCICRSLCGKFSFNEGNLRCFPKYIFLFQLQRSNYRTIGNLAYDFSMPIERWFICTYFMAVSNEKPSSPSPPDKPNVFNHHQHSAIAISNWIISAVSGAFYVGRRSPGKAALSAFNYKNKVSIRSMSIGLSCKTFPIETPLLFVLSKILFTK